MRQIISLTELKSTSAGKRRDNQHLFDDKVKQKRQKYNNKKTCVEGIEFDSEKEAKRFKELRLLLKAGKIAFLAKQVEYQLNVGGNYDYKYIADFVYTDTETGKICVEDVKGFVTREFKKKARLMKKIHGIEIKIT